METKKEITINELANKVDKLSGTVNELFGTVDELSGTVDKLAGITQQEFVAAQKRIEAIDNKFDEKFNQVLTGQDHILKRLEDLETDNTAGATVSRRHDDELENYEERIVVAEGKLGVGAV
ncbi:MAG: hypothetical protein KAQ87_01260 [Candidatus Pacebacteria bacterium]|nr:hypothetical protein [Candidatus Paceibacterota bacterium]